MNHPDAIDTGAAERYALGHMSDSERDAYEEHFFDCPECADEVRTAALFMDSARAVLAEKRPAGVPVAGIVPRRPEPSPVSLWDRLRPAFWPMPLGAAAALALLLGGPATYLALVKVPELQRARVEAEGLQAASSYFLTVSRGEPPVVSVSGSQRMAGLRLSKSLARSFPYYFCEVRDKGGRVVLANVVPAPPAGELQILLPAGRLEPGAYVIAVAGLESPSSRTPVTEYTLYPFTFERRPQ